LLNEVTMRMGTSLVVAVAAALPGVDFAAAATAATAAAAAPSISLFSFLTICRACVGRHISGGVAIR
jgi:cytochrome c553